MPTNLPVFTSGREKNEDFILFFMLICVARTKITPIITRSNFPRIHTLARSTSIIYEKIRVEHVCDTCKRFLKGMDYYLKISCANNEKSEPRFSSSRPTPFRPKILSIHAPLGRFHNRVKVILVVISH